MLGRGPLTGLFVILVLASAAHVDGGYQAVANDLVLSIEVDRRVSCEVDPRDHLYEEVFYVTEFVTNRGAAPVALFEGHRSGALLFRNVDDAKAGRRWMDFVGDYEPRGFHETPRHLLAPGETRSNEAVFSIVVRKPGIQQALWPLGPGRHVFVTESFRVVDVSLAHNERAQGPIAMLRLLSQPVEFELAAEPTIQPCSAVNGRHARLESWRSQDSVETVPGRFVRRLELIGPDSA